MNKQNRIILLTTAIAFLVVSVIPLSNYILSFVAQLLSMREGSNNTRLLIYAESLESFLKSPIIGCGIKKIGKVRYPLGSHSSYIGFLYKTGIAGSLMILGAFIYQMITLIKKYIQSKDLKNGVCIFFILLMYGYCILEDIDGADWLICIWFAVIGILNKGIFLDKREAQKVICHAKSIDDLYS